MGSFVEDFMEKQSSQLAAHECHCGVQAFNDLDLQKHINDWHSGGNWPCSYPGCTKVYQKSGVVKNHYRNIHKKIKLWKCKLCPYQNDEEPEVKRHLHLKHNIQSDIVCPNCKKVFGQKNKLVKHIPLCGHNLKAFMCPVEGCGKGFRSKYTLENHRVNIHPEPDEEPPKFICEFCFVIYQSATALSAHKKDKHL